MNKLSFNKFLVFSLIFSLTLAVCEAQSFDRPKAPRQQHHKPVKSKTAKVKGSKSVEKAKKKQAAKDKKHDKDYEKLVRENQKHSMEIQTTKVKSRMKQNVKDSNSSYKAKKKKNTARTKTGRKKYK
jgi:hypothetical protein